MRSCIIPLLLVTFPPLGAHITGRIIDVFNDEPVVNAMVISSSKSWCSYPGNCTVENKACPPGYRFMLPILYNEDP
jgi:hypothetical protein